MKVIKSRLFWQTLLIVLAPIVGMGLGLITTIAFDIYQADISNLVINLFFLAASIGLIWISSFSRQELGLKVIRDQLNRHVFISLVIFGLYVLFYVFVIRITHLKPFTASTALGLLTYLVAVIAEELYFRGLLYGFVEKRFSSRGALIISSLLFGLFHVRQGLSGIILRTFTGWLWGSVRYSTGMIFLLIFPVHFAYNATWLLFAGNWNNPPAWGIYALPAVEVLLGTAIVIVKNRRSALS